MANGIFLGGMEDFSLLGSKSRNLHSLKLLGLPIPEGFVCESNGDLLAHIKKIGGFPLAVRSSAVHEDNAGDSFAGLYESFLEITDFPSLETAIAKCRESAVSPRVLNYANHKKAQLDVEILNKNFNVLIQKFIKAKWSGVLFTLDPQSGKEEFMALECCEGAGDKLVSGKITPIHYTIDSRTSKVVTSSGPALNESHIEELAKLGQIIATHFGRPQDIEWAIDGSDKIWILQSRPISAINWRTDLGEYSNADLKDGGISSRVCTPLMYSLYNYCTERSMNDYFQKLHLLRRDENRRWMVHKYGIVYWNVGQVKEAVKKIPGFTEDSFDKDLGIEKDYEKRLPHTTPANIQTLTRAIPILFGLKKEYRAVSRSILNALDGFPMSHEHYLDEIKNFNHMTDEKFYTAFKLMFENHYVQTETLYFRTIYNNSNYQTEFKDFLKKLDKKLSLKINYLSLIDGLGDVSHFEMQKDLLKLVEMKTASAAKDSEITHEIGKFLKKHYYYSENILDITLERWGENHQLFEKFLEAFISSQVKIRPVDESRNHQTVLNGILKENKSTGIFSSLRSKRLVSKLNKARWFLRQRENMRGLSGKCYFVLRKYILEAGLRFKSNGMIENEGDVFYLHIEEIINQLKERKFDKALLEEISFRKKQYASFRNFLPPNEFGPGIFSETDAPLEKAGVRGKSIRGIACSRGLLTGKVRVLNDLSEAAEILEGEILVTKFTDPSWTPVLGLAAGLITEFGGVLSHAAIIAREYAIPAVLNVKAATREFKTGDLITIYGSSGEIIFH